MNSRTFDIKLAEEEKKLNKVLDSLSKKIGTNKAGSSSISGSSISASASYDREGESENPSSYNLKKTISSSSSSPPPSPLTSSKSPYSHSLYNKSSLKSPVNSTPNQFSSTQSPPPPPPFSPSSSKKDFHQIYYDQQFQDLQLEYQREVEKNKYYQKQSAITLHKLYNKYNDLEYNYNNLLNKYNNLKFLIKKKIFLSKKKKVVRLNIILNSMRHRKISSVSIPTLASTNDTCTSVGSISSTKGGFSSINQFKRMYDLDKEKKRKEKQLQEEREKLVQKGEHDEEKFEEETGEKIKEANENSVIDSSSPLSTQIKNHTVTHEEFEKKLINELKQLEELEKLPLTKDYYDSDIENFSVSYSSDESESESEREQKKEENEEKNEKKKKSIKNLLKSSIKEDEELDSFLLHTILETTSVNPSTITTLLKKYQNNNIENLSNSNEINSNNKNINEEININNENYQLIKNNKLIFCINCNKNYYNINNNLNKIKYNYEEKIFNFFIKISSFENKKFGNLISRKNYLICLLLLDIVDPFKSNFRIAALMFEHEIQKEGYKFGDMLNFQSFITILGYLTDNLQFSIDNTLGKRINFLLENPDAIEKFFTTFHNLLEDDFLIHLSEYEEVLYQTFLRAKNYGIGESIKVKNLLPIGTPGASFEVFSVAIIEDLPLPISRRISQYTSNIFTHENFGYFISCFYLSCIITLREREKAKIENRKKLNRSLESYSKAPLSSTSASLTQTHEKLYQTKTINSASYTSTVRNNKNNEEQDDIEASTYNFFDFDTINVNSFYKLIEEFGNKCFAARDSKKIA